MRTTYLLVVVVRLVCNYVLSTGTYHSGVRLITQRIIASKKKLTVEPVHINVTKLPRGAFWQPFL